MWSAAEQRQWMEHPAGPAEFSDCIGIVDATYLEIERPKDAVLERRCYSTYKKHHTLFVTVITDRLGEQHAMRVQQPRTT